MDVHTSFREAPQFLERSGRLENRDDSTPHLRWAARQPRDQRSPTRSSHLRRTSPVANRGMATGSGPNPHSPLALMKSCFVSASVTWPERFDELPGLQTTLADGRVAAISSQPLQDSAERTSVHCCSPRAGLVPKFEAELAFGEAYQRTAARTQTTKSIPVPINDAHFFDEFHADASYRIQSRSEEWHAARYRARSTASFTPSALGFVTGALACCCFAIVVSLLC